MTSSPHALVMVLAAAILFPVVASTPAQDTGASTTETRHSTLDEIKTLDQVRKLGPISEPGFSEAGRPGGMLGRFGGEGYGGESEEEYSSMGGMYDGREAAPPDPRRASRQKVEDLRSKLTSPDHDQKKLQEQLRTALSEYFVADMRHRVRELDEIKRRVAKMEAQLARRLKLGNEAVELQLKIFVRDAEGLGFFRTEDRPGEWRSGLR